MSPARKLTPQQRDARELARTPPANPYRGTLTDPFSRPVAGPPTDSGQGTDRGLPVRDTTGRYPVNRHATDRYSDDRYSDEQAAYQGQAVRPSGKMPSGAALAGILGIALGLTLGLFGLLLLTIVSLQNDYGAPDRSFYRGTDSGYVVLGLVNFSLAACCAIGGILLMTGRLTGRIVLTIGGWATILLSGFWLVDGAVRALVPIVLTIAAATTLFFSYQRRVTDWLGVLPPPQPE